jgi:hypothetical protein
LDRVKRLGVTGALTDGLIMQNPCTSVKPPKAPAARVQPWAAEWVDGVRKAMPARCRALADVRAGLGLRQGEAFGLAAGDIDWLHRIVHVRRQVCIIGSTLCFAPPKGGRERDIPLPDSIALRLSTYVAACPPVPVSLPWKVPGGKPVTASLLFTAPGGAALAPVQLQRRRLAASTPGSGPAVLAGERHARPAALLLPRPACTTGWTSAPWPVTSGIAIRASRCGPTCT